ncbi:hypothetical protein EIN_065390 [Entamoeba invadens IP1]|uniref:DH domain-containing protein n=1 Tax=Entamoeba invadens IP1 TaxID=370355 RepID=A0A0A1TV93_ENTIV|nr:hypothetical protein EIN_065390 [Entamoeba invadens IP1]ELP84274.1 hypothetical protein EIN_065390 [Entamoeba invadens IP1]|eukprot:XP_004183620.1 hypothetical protein EIN_065390 [Entamoeba invadens IP1]
MENQPTHLPPEKKLPSRPQSVSPTPQNYSVPKKNPPLCPSKKPTKLPLPRVPTEPLQQTKQEIYKKPIPPIPQRSSSKELHSDKEEPNLLALEPKYGRLSVGARTPLRPPPSPPLTKPPQPPQTQNNKNTNIDSNNVRSTPSIHINTNEERVQKILPRLSFVRTRKTSLTPRDLSTRDQTVKSCSEVCVEKFNPDERSRTDIEDRVPQILSPQFGEEVRREPFRYSKKYLNKLRDYFTDEDLEDKVAFVPKLGKTKIFGTPKVMRVAELMFTEFTFCAKLEIFQIFEEEIRREIPLLQHQDFILFNPLDNLVETITSLCDGLDPLYDTLLKSTPETEELVIFGVYQVYSNFLTDTSHKGTLEDVYSKFIAHYTTLSPFIDKLFEDTSKLKKLVNELLENCIDKNIKEFKDLFYCAMQRVCRFELITDSVIKEFKTSSQVLDEVQQAKTLFKETNKKINTYISQSKLFYTKKFECLTSVYGSNGSIRSASIVNSAFSKDNSLLDYFTGVKATVLGFNEVELFLFNEGILKQENGVFAFYPICTVLSGEMQEHGDPSKTELTDTDVVFYDVNKNKLQVINLGSKDLTDKFNSELKIAFEQFMEVVQNNTNKV